MRSRAFRMVLLAAALSLSLIAAASAQGLEAAVSLLNEGRVEEAIPVLRAAARQLPDPSRAAPLLGEAYLRLGMQNLNGGDGRAAREAFAEARSFLPDDARPLQGIAISWLHEGQATAAVDLLREALTLAGGDPALWLLLGRAYYAQGDLLQAEEAWVQAGEAGDASAQPLLEKVRRERRAESTMTRDLAGRFTIGYAAGVSDPLAAAVLETLQEAYSDLGADLGYYPEADIPVLLYLREDFSAVTRSPDWAGAVYDGKIRVPLGGVRKMTAPLRALLHHEYAHVVIRFLGRGQVPVWLNEGLAEVSGRKHFQPVIPPLPAGQELKGAALERPFGELPAELVPLAYQASYLRVNRLLELCGWPPLAELLLRLGQGEGWERAVAEAYAPCGYDWPLLQVELAGKLN